ncbi:4Fe-4S binding protein [Desulfovibrio sp. TomC]|uniref:4Fe-4S binding protein n=1 Tax=Desulfovibrio sp. TomC TaxID=1562888 RepID=UPI000574CE8E|nr:4Fe-4S binding protein [Desulfovibrio sp. TomC]KHK00804.1 putative iron-sulfur cluster binding protein YccM [Desulfovibrio sp. TomC]
MSYRPTPKALVRLPQWFFFVATLAVGVQFVRFCLAVAAGSADAASRPAGVEGFLPISALLGLRRLLAAGSFDPVHPAGLWILLAAIVMAVLFRKAFCGHICPVGFLAVRLGRLGQRLKLARSVGPRQNALLGLPKYLLLAFFLFTTFFGMDLAGVDAFLRSSYNITADARLLLFFASPSAKALLILAGLAGLGLVFRGSFCRWLCPYGALLGLLAKVGPTALARDAAACTGCGRCRTVCPMDIPIDASPRPMTCTACASCVVACPRRESAVRFVFAGLPVPWWTTAAGACGVFALAYAVAHALGLWNATLPQAMLARLYAMALGG